MKPITDPDAVHLTYSGDVVTVCLLRKQPTTMATTDIDDVTCESCGNAWAAIMREAEEADSRKLITLNDIRDQVRESLGGEDACFNVTDIADEIHATYGLIDIDTVSDAEYWAIVNRHYIDAN